MLLSSLVNDSFNVVTSIDFSNVDVSGVVCTDLLSFAMGKANYGDILITIMNNNNSVAVASLLDLSCIIIPFDLDVPTSMVERANENGIVILQTKMTNVEVIKFLSDLGVC